MVILWTNRTGKHLKEAVEWCHKKDIHLDAVNENPAHTKLWIQMSGIEESQKYSQTNIWIIKNSTFYISRVK